MLAQWCVSFVVGGGSVSRWSVVAVGCGGVFVSAFLMQRFRSASPIFVKKIDEKNEYIAFNHGS